MYLLNLALPPEKTSSGHVDLNVVVIPSVSIHVDLSVLYIGHFPLDTLPNVLDAVLGVLVDVRELLGEFFEQSPRDKRVVLPRKLHRDITPFSLELRVELDFRFSRIIERKTVYHQGLTLVSFHALLRIFPLPSNINSHLLATPIGSLFIRRPLSEPHRWAALHSHPC